MHRKGSLRRNPILACLLKADIRRSNLSTVGNALEFLKPAQGSQSYRSNRTSPFSLGIDEQEWRWRRICTVSCSRMQERDLADIERELRAEELLNTSKEDYMQIRTFDSAEDRASIVSIISMIDQKLWSTDCEDRLKHAALKLEPFLVAQVSKKLSSVDVAFGFFNWARKIDGYRHLTYNYNVLLEIIAEAGRYEELNFLLEKMQVDSCIPDYGTFSILLKCYGKAVKIEELLGQFICSFGEANKLKEMLEILDKLELVDWVPSTSTYTYIINFLLREDALHDAIRWKERTLKEQSANGFYIYTIFILALCRTNNLHGACKLLKEMESRGYKPNYLSFVTIIKSLCRIGKADDAYKFFEEMLRRGCPPTQSTYNMLIESLGNFGKVDKAFQVFKMLKQNGIALKLITYNTMLNTFCKTGSQDRAYSLFQSMKEGGCEVDKISYSILIDYLGRSGQMAKACALYLEMLEVGHAPDSILHNILVQNFAKVGDVYQARRFFKDMASKGHQFTPAVFNNLVLAYCKLGRPLVALTFLEGLKGLTGYANSTAYNHIVVSFSISDNCEMALNVYQEMEVTGIVPEVNTYCALLDVLDRNGKLDIAMNVVEDMKGSSQILDSVYEKMIEILGKTGKMSEAFDLFREMEARGIKPTLDTYASLIYRFGRQYRLDVAYRLLDEMEEKGYDPSSLAFNAMINVLAKGGLLEEANNMYGRMTQKGCKPDSITYELLISANRRANKHEMVSSLMQDRTAAAISLPENNSNRLQTSNQNEDIHAVTLPS